MNRIAAFVVRRIGLAWSIAVLSIVIGGLVAGYAARELRSDYRLSLLETQVRRDSVEIMSQTLNGNLMGSLSMLGMLDAAVKSDARKEGQPNSALMTNTLESVARSYDADGMFVVGEDGIVRSSWDNSGKPSTGINVKFRPYYQMAMQGQSNVYAAVSLARGDRSLYFAAPVFAEMTSGTDGIGAVVARTGVLKLDDLLRSKADIALLLSPQGVVFASNRAEWVGRLAEKPTPEKLRAIRELKQFGNMFENKEPTLLPVAINTGMHDFDGRRYAVASAGVQWNDPFGDWKLVELEDLTLTVPLSEQLWVVAAVSGIMLLFGVAILNTLRSHAAQLAAMHRVEEYASAQQRAAERKAQLAAASLSFQQAKTLEDLSSLFLKKAHEVFGSLQGVVYLADENPQDSFCLAASYGAGNDLPPLLAPGEGLLGQCVVERRLRIVEAPGDGYWCVRSGLGQTAPAAIVVAPIMLHEEILGAVEFAVLKSGEALREQVEEMIALLAMNLAVLRRALQTEDMLAASESAERVNAEQLAFQQALVDAIPYPVFYKGPDTRFLGFNRAYEETFGVRRETMLGKRVLDLDYLPEADRVAYQNEDEATIVSAGTVHREMRIPFGDGKLHDTLYFVSGFRRPDGSPGGLVGTFMDVSALKDAERDLARLADAERFNRLAQGREQRILELKSEVNGLAQAMGRSAPYATTLVETVGDHHVDPHPDYTPDSGGALSLEALVDLAELQKLFEGFCGAIGIAAAIIDLEGKVLASSRWQRACTDFHRVNPESCARCIESDTELALKLEDGQDFTMYKCKNGMTDCASPIVVEGQHLANVFIGQFHVGAPNIAFFTEQARRFGYDEADYLRAVGDAPVLDEARLPVILGFLSGFARMVTTMSLARHRADAAQKALERQAVLLRSERLAAMSLAEDNALARDALEQGRQS